MLAKLITNRGLIYLLIRIHELKLVKKKTEQSENWDKNLKWVFLLKRKAENPKAMYGD